MVIQGEHRLSGSVRIGGAKNAALPIMAATLLGGGALHADQCPARRRCPYHVKAPEAFGAAVKTNGDRFTVSVDGIPAEAV